MSRALLALLACAVLAGCGGNGEPAAAGSPSAAATPAARTEPTCPPASASAADFPADVPAELPEPPGTAITEVQDRTDGLTVVQFTTPSSLRESVLFVLDALPAAGFTLGRGDAETTEADAPFVKGDLRGVLRMIAVQPCRTDWLLAVTRGTTGSGTGNPLLPSRPSASPLPFG